ncbi:MAG: hypothetical protein M3R14_10870 [Acidobacteriota bacterium]|nr:hypothetical protein [Acidobacteriota bacterium]
MKIKRTRSAFLLKLRVVKRRAKDEDASNNSMDVRARAAIFLSRCPLNFTWSLAVLSHIHSVAGLLTKFENLGINVKAGFYEI